MLILDDMEVFDDPVKTSSLGSPIAEYKPASEQALRVDIETILSATDLQEALRELAQKPNLDELTVWQEQILLVAREAGYLESELMFLRGEQGRQYLHFRGRRLLFDTLIQSAYREGRDPEAIIAQFPEAADLRAKTRSLFIQRDALIESIAQALLEESSGENQKPLSDEQANRAALSIWRQRNTEG